MRRPVRWLLAILGVLAAVVAACAVVVYALSERRLRRTYPVPPERLTLAADAAPATAATAATVARGAHLATSAATCVLCHGEDLGGKIYADAGPMGLVVGPNLTRGRGGLGTGFTRADWVRAIRYGVRRDGTSLVVMPSEVYAHLSDPDLAAIVLFLEGLPPVDREVPPTRFRPLGRALLAAGRLDILVAPKTPRLAERPHVEPAPTAAYGRYLAGIGGCHGCHGYGLSGGRVAGPPDLPPASNLTPAGPLARWSEADFVRAMRAGRRPDGSTLDEFMPWRTLGRMTDEELHALWLYLAGVPPKAFGNK
jgi:cytochrome c553